MSGILCVYSPFGIEQDSQHYLAALRLLAHRGPDGEGTEIRKNIFVGARSTSIGRKGNERCPFTDGNGRVIVALDGHIHNRGELSQILQSRGHTADWREDDAVVLAAYLEYGDQCFEKFRGVWALVLWDERDQRLFVARGPLGVKPLYYHDGGQRISVASEIKCILRLDDVSRAIDHESIQNLVRDGHIDDWTRTCFSKIKPVPPGTYLRLDQNPIRSGRFWTLSPLTDEKITTREIFDTLASAVERHTPADVNVGLSLSGGIDSSSIAGILAQPAMRGTHRIQAFSISPPQTTDESHLINATIRRTGIPHTFVSLDALDHSEALARLIDFHDEPIQYSGSFYQFVLREYMAQSGCRAVLVGYGADEIFGGYEYLAPYFLMALASDGRWSDSARFLKGATEFLGSSPLGIAKHTLRVRGGRAEALIYGAIRRAIGIGKARSRHSNSRTSREVLAPLSRTEASGTRSALVGFDLRGLDVGQIFFRALLECFRANIPLLVRVEDRNAMAHRLELCAPFMDEDVVRVALSFPFYRYMEGGRSKATLRDAMREVLAPEVYYSRKKTMTPGSDAYVAFDVLQAEFLDLLGSKSFRESGIWTNQCLDLYKADLAARERAEIWFRVYLTHAWYERVVRGERHELLAKQSF